MAVKSNGIFTLGKLNADEEGVIAKVLGVTGYPTLFGCCKGRVVNKMVGMPKNEEGMKDFMTKLVMGGASEEGMEDVGGRLLRAASNSAFKFGDRERTGEAVRKVLEGVREDRRCMNAVGLAARLIENVASKPREGKFRFVNLGNDKVRKAFEEVPELSKCLKIAGFGKVEGGWRVKGDYPNIAVCMCVGEGMRGWVKQADFGVTRDAREVREGREMERAKREQEEVERVRGEEEGRERERRVKEKEGMKGKTRVKWRIEGKKRVKEAVVEDASTMTDFLESVDVSGAREIVSAGKGKVVEEGGFGGTWGEHGMTGNVNVVVRLERDGGDEEGKVSLQERAMSNRKKKKGSHTMQSAGIYGREDGRKGNFVDGGGGTVYELTDEDEDEIEEEGGGRGGEEEEDEEGSPYG